MKLLHYFKFKLVNHAHSNFFFGGGRGTSENDSWGSTSLLQLALVFIAP